MFLQMDHTWTDRETMYISYIGKLFLRMLKALILPLIIPSLVAAVGSLDMSLSGKVGEDLRMVQWTSETLLKTLQKLL